MSQRNNPSEELKRNDEMSDEELMAHVWFEMQTDPVWLMVDRMIERYMWPEDDESDA